MRFTSFQGLPPGPATHMRRTSQADTDDRPHTSQRQLGDGDRGHGVGHGDHAELADRFGVSALRPALQRPPAAPTNTAGPRLPGGPSFDQVQRGKPSSVPPSVSPPHSIDGGSGEGPAGMGGHFSGRPVARTLKRSTRPARPGQGWTLSRPRAARPCTPVGFALPRLSPAGRCALTAPFHPCLIPVRKARPSAVCFLWHFPSPGADPSERVGVTHHRVLRCSDFPQHRAKTQPACRGRLAAPIRDQSLPGTRRAPQKARHASPHPP
jgi:hypothetical protein